MNFLTALKSSHSLNFNNTHFKIKLKGKQYYVGYKSVKAQSTPRSYDHLSRYGTTRPRTFNINSGKYALGNNPNDKSDYSLIHKVLELETDKMIKIVIKWKRQQMKTVVTILKNKFT